MAKDHIDATSSGTPLAAAASDWRPVVEALRDAVCLLDLNGNVIQCNAAFARFVERPAGDATGQSCCTMVCQGPSRPPGCPFPRMLASRAHEEGEFLRGDRRIWVSLDPVLDESGALVGAVHVLSDISERRLADEALELLKHSIDIASDAAFWNDPAGRFIYVNDAACRSVGYERDELLRMELSDINPRAHPARWAEVWEILRTKTTIHLESVHRRKDGSQFPVDLVSTYVRFGDREYACGFARDITERKRAEDARRQSAATLRALLDATSDAALLIDGHGSILAANQTMSRSLGRGRSEIVGKNAYDLLPDDVARLWKARIDEVLRSREPIRFEGDNNGAWYDNSVIPVVDAQGDVVSLAIYARDITEQRRFEDRLRQSQKMEAVGILAGGVAHDFNNLLQAMISQAHLIRGQADDPVKVRALSRELEQEITRGASLTRQLLLFSRRETSKPVRLDVNDEVRDATRMLQRLVRANIALAIELAGGRLPVDADRGQLQQVLVNLSVNASDSMPDGGTLTIRTGALDRGEVWLSVADTGQGIPGTIRERIFEPFFTTKGVGKGTGLGLAVVQGIVSQHGGRIEVESEVGRGTTVTVIIPRAISAEGAAGDEALAVVPELERGSGERILVVEDEETTLAGLREILASLGYEALAVGDGEEAMRLAPSRPFDLLLTDVMLPGVSGSQLAEVMTTRWPSLKVILMSGYNQDEAVRRGIGTGAVRFLQKPFDIVTLAREVRAALGERSGGP